MDSKIILGRLLQRFIELGSTQYQNLNAFGFIELKSTHVMVSRERGADTRIDFKKLITAIEEYKKNIDMYDLGPSALRDLGLTHVTSPIYSMLHLLTKDAYCL